MTRLATIAALLVLAPGAARANSVYATACMDPVDFESFFEISDRVCLTGDLDYTCRSGFLMLPGVDIYVVPRGAPPFSGVPIELRDVLGGAGSFSNEALWDPPLTPGVYDVILDEHCDGVFDGDDLRADALFEVRAPAMCTLPPGTEMVNPGIAGGALCRGACGPDCPGVTPPGTGVFAVTPIHVCSDTTTTTCIDDAASCTHVECTMRTLACGSHPGCRDHDACYDACAARGAPPVSVCTLTECDAACVGSYGMLCNSWRQGGGPFDRMLGFAYPPTAVTSGGLCSGAGC